MVSLWSMTSAPLLQLSNLFRTELWKLYLYSSLIMWCMLLFSIWNIYVSWVTKNKYIVAFLISFIDVSWGQYPLLVKCQFICTKEIMCAGRCWFLSVNPYVGRHTSGAKPKHALFIQCPKEWLIILMQIVVLAIPKNLSLANMAQFETSSLHSEWQT